MASHALGRRPPARVSGALQEVGRAVRRLPLEVGCVVHRSPLSLSPLDDTDAVHFVTPTPAPSICQNQSPAAALLSFLLPCNARIATIFTSLGLLPESRRRTQLPYVAVSV